MKTITMKEVCKDFPKSSLRFMDRINLEIHSGEILGILGHNGSGKTTLLKMLSTLTIPASGEIMFDGLNIIKEPQAARQKIGVFLEAERSLYWRLTGYENLERTAALKNMSRDAFRRQADYYLKKLELYAHKDKLVSQYSRGMKVKLNMINMLLGNPEVLLLDEPLAGLDHLSRLAALEILDSLRDPDRIIVICSNNLVEAQKICNKVIIMKSGEIIASGEPIKLLQELPGEGIVEIETMESDKMKEWLTERIHPLRMIDSGGKIVILVENLVYAIEKFRRENVISYINIIYREKDLTDYFMIKTEEGNTDDV